MPIKHFSNPLVVSGEKPWLVLDKEFTDMSEYGKQFGELPSENTCRVCLIIRTEKVRFLSLAR